VYLRRSLSGEPCGPFSAPQPIYEIPPPLNNTKLFFCYAPKGTASHAAVPRVCSRMSSSTVHDELVDAVDADHFVWTYVCNSFNINDLIDQPAAYVPTFVVTKITL
jgi:hypothetical protein